MKTIRNKILSKKEQEKVGRCYLIFREVKHGLEGGSDGKEINKVLSATLLFAHE